MSRYALVLLAHPSTLRLSHLTERQTDIQESFDQKIPFVQVKGGVERPLIEVGPREHITSKSSIFSKKTPKPSVIQGLFFCSQVKGGVERPLMAAPQGPRHTPTVGS